MPGCGPERSADFPLSPGLTLFPGRCWNVAVHMKHKLRLKRPPVGRSNVLRNTGVEMTRSSVSSHWSRFLSEMSATTKPRARGAP